MIYSIPQSSKDLNQLHILVLQKRSLKMANDGRRSGWEVFTSLGDHLRAAGMGGPPVGVSHGQLSPYLNVDPSLQRTEYLYSDTIVKRGKFEQCQTAIGGAFCIGSVAGGTYGVYNGIRQTAGMHQGVLSTLRRTQIMNYAMKSGGLVGGSLGTIATSYSLLHCALSNVPGIENNDEAKSVISGTLTGLLFKSTSGLQKCARGGLVGFGLSTLLAFGLKKQEEFSKQ